MTTLNRLELQQRLNRPESDEEALILSPLLSHNQVGDVSIDVRLGNQFILFRQHALTSFDPLNTSDSARRIQERQVLPYDRHLTLHPGMLVLASTLEYIRMPKDLECQVEGRSSWARVGLLVATATTVEPGFTGVITLELSNAGTTPLVLRPLHRIAQLIFRNVTKLPKTNWNARKYRFPIGPQFSRVAQDEDAQRLHQQITLTAKK